MYMRERKKGDQNPPYYLQPSDRRIINYKAELYGLTPPFASRMMPCPQPSITFTARCAMRLLTNKSFFIKSFIDLISNLLSSPLNLLLLLIAIPRIITHNNHAFHAFLLLSLSISFPLFQYPLNIYSHIRTIHIQCIFFT